MELRRKELKNLVLIEEIYSMQLYWYMDGYKKEVAQERMERDWSPSLAQRQRADKKGRSSVSGCVRVSVCAYEYKQI